MSEQYPWRFEPCENEGPIRDTKGTPWAHAVRGRKPQRPAITGYGHTPNAADADARTKASQQDAREVLGARCEVVTQLKITIRTIDIHKTMLTVYDALTDEAIIQGQLVATDFYAPPINPRMSGLGSASWDMIDDWPGFDMMPMGT